MRRDVWRDVVVAAEIAAIVMAVALVLGGCASVRFRTGPIGSGIATTVDGPGIEAAISDSNGVPLVAGRLAISVQGVFLTAWTALREFLPGFAAALGSNAPVPTGPLLEE